NPVAARGRRDQQDPQLRGDLVDWYTKHAAGPLPVDFRDPPRLPTLASSGHSRWVVLAGRPGLRGEVGHDPRDQRLEAEVPALLARVDLAVGPHHPPQASRQPDWPDHDRRLTHGASN